MTLFPSNNNLQSSGTVFSSGNFGIPWTLARLRSVIKRPNTFGHVIHAKTPFIDFTGKSKSLASVKPIADP